MLPDEILLDINGPTAVDVAVTDAIGRPILNAVSVTIRYRAGEVGTVEIEALDESAPVIGGELPIVRRTYAATGGVVATITAFTLIDQAVA